MVKSLPYGSPKNWECTVCGKQYKHWILAVRHENKCFIKVPNLETLPSPMSTEDTSSLRSEDNG